MHPAQAIRKRLRRAGYAVTGQWVAGSTWALELTKGGQTVQVTGPGQLAACERALRS